MKKRSLLIFKRRIVTADFVEEDDLEVNEEVVGATTEDSNGPIVINTLEDLQNVVADSNISIQGPAAHETLKQETLKSVLNPTQEKPDEPEVPQESRRRFF